MNKRINVLLILFITGSLCASQAVPPGEDLQAVLDSGSDLVLQQGAVYEISSTLRYKTPGQRIYTEGAQFPSEYATLKLAAKDLMMLINASGVEDAVLERVICDGDRYNLSVVPKPPIGGGGQPALVHFGGDGSDGQIIRDCVFINTRTWSTLKMHEGASNMLAENNLFFGAGVGPRGNGREKHEKPFGWSDGISCAATDSLIRNNLIIDPTDVGVVLYCAPGTVVDGNLVASISRESLGGINLVDGLDYFAMNEEKTLFDYRGSKVTNNYIDAFGARIHMAIPVGCVVWVPHWAGKILHGGEVSGNTISGGAAGYGIVAHGISDWKIVDNISIASYSGLAEYGEHKSPPADPAAFLYDAESVFGCELQKEFEPANRHMQHLLRTRGAPKSDLGYFQHDYGHAEIAAVVNAAYLEMLRRDPSEKEFLDTIKIMREHELDSDSLRRKLMVSDEFIARNGELHPDELQPYRVKLWFDICDALIRERHGMYSAIELYHDALAALRLDP